jgi:hypothetical protein
MSRAMRKFARELRSAASRFFLAEAGIVENDNAVKARASRRFYLNKLQ